MHLAKTLYAMMIIYNIMLQPKSSLTEDKNTSSNHEEITGDLNVGISIRNLTKIYGQVIINNLTQYPVHATCINL